MNRNLLESWSLSSSFIRWVTIFSWIQTFLFEEFFVVLSFVSFLIFLFFLINFFFITIWPIPKRIFRSLITNYSTFKTLKGRPTFIFESSSFQLYRKVGFLFSASIIAIVRVCFWLFLVLHCLIGQLQNYFSFGWIFPFSPLLSQSSHSIHDLITPRK